MYCQNEFKISRRWAKEYAGDTVALLFCSTFANLTQAEFATIKKKKKEIVTCLVKHLLGSSNANNSTNGPD